MLGFGGPTDTVPQRLEPKTFLASERTFLSWMHMSITIGSIAAALLAFSAEATKSSSPMHAISANLVEIIALVLLPLAVGIVAYATLVFVWRNSQIAMKQAAYIDDRRQGWGCASGSVLGTREAATCSQAIDVPDGSLTVSVVLCCVRAGVLCCLPAWWWAR
jgi:uncharacterized membrane protein YidH (DUF202 family)